MTETNPQFANKAAVSQKAMNSATTDLSVINESVSPKEVPQPNDEIGENKKKKYNRVKHAQGKRIKKLVGEHNKLLTTPQTLLSAVKILKSFPAIKFDQTVELVFHLGIDPKQADQIVRGSLSLPHGIGKRKKVIVFCSEEMSDLAKKSGAIDAGLDTLMKRVSDGWLDFDVAVATPEVMPKIAKLGRVLGPQGKMPNPKSGTVTTEIATSVREHVEGKVQFRNDAGGNVHAVIGKFSFSEDKLVQNAESLVDYVKKLRPASTKGHYVRGVILKGTMTPPILIDIGGLQ